MTVRRDAARETPNLRATQVELYDGPRRRVPEPLAVPRASMSGASTISSRRCSRRASTTRPSCGRAPPGATLYEPLIRRAAGLGRAPTQPDPDRYAQRYAHCDVLVVGAGPAGLAAALAAADAGARVILCDEQAEPGGSLLDGGVRAIDGGSAADWLARRSRRSRRRRACALLPRTTAFGYFPHNILGLVERLTDHLADAAGGRGRASACGRCARARSCSRPARSSSRSCFPGNDRPGVMLAGAARTYLQPLRRARGHARGRGDRERCGLPRGARPARGRRRGRGDRGSRASADLGRGRAAAGIEVVAAPRSARGGAARVSGIDDRRRRDDRLRPRADVRRLDAVACTCSRSRAAGSPGATPRVLSCRRTPPSASARPAPAAASTGLAAALADGAAAGAAAAQAAGRAGAAPRHAVSGEEDAPRRGAAAPAGQPRARQRPSSISRTT